MAEITSCATPRPIWSNTTDPLKVRSIKTNGAKSIGITKLRQHRFTFENIFPAMLGATGFSYKWKKSVIAVIE